MTAANMPCAEPRWVMVCRVSDLAPGESKRVDLVPPVAVFNLAGEFFAIADTCSHGQSSLADGYVEDDGSVECAAHMARFCIRTGRALCLPATVDVASYPVEVHDASVWIQVPGE